jgi:hypothetical protein
MHDKSADRVMRTTGEMTIGTQQEMTIKTNPKRRKLRYQVTNQHLRAASKTMERGDSEVAAAGTSKTKKEE